MHSRLHAVESVQALIQAGANVAAHNNLTGATPLHMVAQSQKAPTDRRLQVVDLLLMASSSLATVADNYGNLPVHALRADDQDAVLRQRLQPVASPIVRAIREANLSQVLDCLDSSRGGSSADASFGAGQTPLGLAVHELMAALETSDQQKATALTEICSVLLKAGLTTDQEDDGPPVQQLLQLLQKLYATDNNNNNNDWRIAIPQNVLVQFVVQHQHTVPDGWLQQAARRNHVPMVEFVVTQLQVDPNTPGRQGMTALQFAARSGQIETLVRTHHCFVKQRKKRRGKTTSFSLQREKPRTFFSTSHSYVCRFLVFLRPSFTWGLFL